MNCNNCGSSIRENDKFCRVCGTMVSKELEISKNINFDISSTSNSNLSVSPTQFRATTGTIKSWTNWFKIWSGVMGAWSILQILFGIFALTTFINGRMFISEIFYIISSIFFTIGYFLFCEEKRSGVTFLFVGIILTIPYIIFAVMDRTDPFLLNLISGLFAFFFVGLFPCIFIFLVLTKKNETQ